MTEPNTTINGTATPVRSHLVAYQYKVSRIGEPEPSPKIDTPELARDYWRDVIACKEWFDPSKEHAVVLTLNTTA